MNKITEINNVHKGSTVLVKTSKDIVPIIVTDIVNKSLAQYVISSDGVAYFLKDGIYTY